MNNKLHHTLIDSVNILLQFIIVYLLLSILQHFFDPASALHALILIPAPFISYELKKYTRHFWSFMLLHLLLITVYAFLVSNPFVKVLYITYLSILTITSYYYKHKAQFRHNTSIFYVLFIFIMYLGCQLLHMPDMQRLCFLLGIVYIMLFLLNTYLLNLNRFVQEHSHLTNVPFQQIKNSNNVLAAFLCGLFLLAMLLFSSLPLGSSLTALVKVIVWLINGFFSLFHKEKPEQVIEEMPVPEETPMPNKLPDTDSSYLLELLSKIFDWFATIITIAGIVCLLLYAIYRIYKYFYLKSEEVIKDKVEFISPFIKNEHLKKVRKERLHTIFGHSNNAIIRKYFFKAVSINIDSHTELPKSLTPVELTEYAIGKASSTETAAPEEEEKRQLLTTYYEKARYSNMECTKEEVQRVKNILKPDK